ncbi:MAG: N-acetyltransferase [Hahellaceae bacterium]|nr:N-acetyltransferase [Hahellaceae bacterium]
MIHNTAIVSPQAKLGKNVKIGHFSVIHDNVVIGDNTTIEGFCEIGYPTALATNKPLIIGNDSLIRSHSLFYAGSIFKDKLTTGHRVTVRENTQAGINLQIGTLSDIQGDCIIGDYVRTHSNVHIGKNSRIGNYIWIFPYVVLTNDPHPPSETMLGVTIKDYAIISTMAVILPGITVHEHTLVGAHSLVNRDVRAGMLVAGNPAKEICEAASIKLREHPELSAYPWPRHFDKGYPDSVKTVWRDLFGNKVI